MRLEIAPETRTEGPKQSIFRTIDLEVFALRSVWNQHRCVSWRAATSFGSPSVWCWPWTTGHHSLLPGVALGSHSPSLCLLSHFCLFWPLSLWLSQHSTFILIEAHSHVSYRMSKTLSRFNTQINSPHCMNEKTETQGEGRREKGLVEERKGEPQSRQISSIQCLETFQVKSHCPLVTVEKVAACPQVLKN